MSDEDEYLSEESYEFEFEDEDEDDVTQESEEKQDVILVCFGNRFYLGPMIL